MNKRRLLGLPVCGRVALAVAYGGDGRQAPTTTQNPTVTQPVAPTATLEATATMTASPVITATQAATQPPLGVHCGTERWPVKTLSDRDAASVNFTAVQSSVTELRGLNAPASLPQSSRVAPTEITVYSVTAQRTVYLGY